MEYKELITRARQADFDTPDTEVILSGMHRTLRRRRQQRQALLSAMLVVVVGTSAYFLQPHYEVSATLVEKVSLHIDTPATKTPAPLVGYRHSMYNRQIYTLL